MRTGFLLSVLVGTLILTQALFPADKPMAGLQAGFGEIDITPPVGKNKRPVYLAGFGQNRKASGVNDPIMARAVVLADGPKKIALVSVDLVGLFLEVVSKVRGQLPGFEYVLVSSTHNHEGPDTLGLWGPNPLTSGIDLAYLKQVEAGIVAAVKKADQARKPVEAKIGAAQAPDLLADSREPYLKHDELVALQLQEPKGGQNVGLIVQWNCHPETLSSKNTLLSSDFVGYTVKHLQDKFQCPVVYLTGTVGGLMSSLGVKVLDEDGKPLANGTFAKTAKYGQLVGQLAEKALGRSKPVALTPFNIRQSDLFLPMDNKLYMIGHQLGVLQRSAYVWNDNPYKAAPLKGKLGDKERMAIQSEIGWLKLGELEVAAIPGEIYPELVLGKVQDPADPGADFPDAPIEPGIYGQMKSKYRLLIGLANDEIGYIIPKRQWDEKPPFCYGRKTSQYGEVNSLGPETAPIVCNGFCELLKKK